MPLTAAEKMRRRRQKLKEEGKYEEYNEKIRERMKIVREKKKQEIQKLGTKKREKLLSEERKKVRERVSKCRRLKKEKEIASSPVGYKSSSTLGKAVARVRKLVFNAQRFCDVAQSASEVKVILMNDQDILEINDKLNLNKVFKTAPEVKGISKIHAMESTEDGLKTYFLTKDMLLSTELGKRQKKTRSIYSLVYSSSSESDNEDITPITQQQEGRSKITPNDIEQGTFVKVMFDHQNCSKTYTYVAICQTSVDSEMDVRILCLNKVANSHRLFTVNSVEAEPYINIEQILEILPEPDIELHGERMYYSFEKQIKVNEK